MMKQTTQSITIEEGAIRLVDALLDRVGAQRLFFVVDKPAYEHSGARIALQDCLSGRETVWFSGFELNPKIEDVAVGVGRFRHAAPDVVVALGGGSALDMAKLIRACGVQEGRPHEYVTGERPLVRPGPPMIAIPTTSGTGSEATHFAVVYLGGRKFSLADPSLLPDYALLDPQLTFSLSPHLTAACGLDALCQAAESIWAVGASGQSIKYASQSLKLALDHLKAAVHDPASESRIGMAMAAHLSGKAINISKTTAPHAISYAITTRYGVPHGFAVALTLGSFLAYNYRVDEASCNHPNGPAVTRERIKLLLTLIGDGSVEQAQSRLQSIMANVGCPLRLQDVGIGKADLPWLVGQVNMERLSNNPRKISSPQLLSLLEEIV